MFSGFPPDIEEEEKGLETGFIINRRLENLFLV
jgi:hypothetical protein